MRPIHWCVSSVGLFAVAISSPVFAQNQLPPAGARQPISAPAAQPLGAPQAPPQAAPRGTVVAVIDIKYIFDNHIRFKNAMEAIKKDFEAFEAHVKNVEANQRKQIEQLKSMQAGSPEFKSLETEIATRRTQVQLDINNKQKERLEQEAQVYFNAYQELETAIARFSDRHGIDLVLQFSSAEIDPAKPDSVVRGLSRIVVFQNQLNITRNILEDLNRSAPTQVAAPVQPGPRNALAPPGAGSAPKTGFPKTTR